MIRMAQPSHPGRFVRMEVIEPLGLSITDAAKALGVTRPALSALVNGRAALSSEMALRIEKGFRAQDGHATQDAGGLRDRQGQEAGRRDRGIALHCERPEATDRSEPVLISRAIRRDARERRRLNRGAHAILNGNPNSVGCPLISTSLCVSVPLWFVIPSRLRKPRRHGDTEGESGRSQVTPQL